MQALGGYGSGSEEDEEPAVVKKPRVELAPDVNAQDLSSYRPLTSPKTKELTHNMLYQDLAKPVAGPANPWRAAHQEQKNTLTGYVERFHVNDVTFNTLQRTYHNFGYTVDPNSNGDVMVGNAEVAYKMNGATINDSIKREAPAPKRKARGDVVSDPLNFTGPWAGYEEERVGPGTIAAPSEAERYAAEYASTGTIGGIATPANTNEPVVVTVGSTNPEKAEIQPGSERTVFHGESEKDYLGRTYMHVPTDLDVNLLGESGSQECFLPKKLIHTWTGHTKGVNAIRFFPKSGHLLLSCSMDGKAKLWDVYHDRRVLRTYIGHSKGIRDVSFNNDGTRFLTASYDRFMKLWDTETGQCISSFTTRKTPYCIKFNPDDDKQHIFLAGMQDKKIVQFDINSGEITQEYDQHLGAVNTITFVDDNRRFVTTSDDKTLRVWEYDIPVVIKYIAEPDMHSMPAAALSPNKKWLVCTSLDNQIVVYSARDRFRENRKKGFRGHLIAGYACQPSFSPDGRFISSGDSAGFVWFWDWKSCKVLKKMKCHDRVVLNAEWHPHETSKMATCSWDGTINETETTIQRASLPGNSTESTDTRMLVQDRDQGYHANPNYTMSYEWYDLMRVDIRHKAFNSFEIARRQSILANLKIYVYDMDPATSGKQLYEADNSRIMRNCRLSYWAYEVFFHEYLLQSPYITKNASEASLFYIPIYSSCYFFDIGWKSIANATALVRDGIKSLAAKEPRVQAALDGKRKDHIIVYSHGRGSVYAPPEMSSQFIHISPFRAGPRDIITPLFAIPEGLPNRNAWHYGFREYFATFAGSCAPSNSAPIRIKLCDLLDDLLKSDPAFFSYPRITLLALIAGHKWRPKIEHFDEMRRTTFCLAPAGWSPSSVRFFESVYGGCIPVLIGSDDIDFPFADTIHLQNAIVWIPEEDISRMFDILLAIDEQEVIKRQLILREIGPYNFYYMWQAIQLKKLQIQEARDKVIEFPKWLEESYERDAFDNLLLDLAHRSTLVSLT
ncbi:hypothetical protein SmJEL517_g02354 [Synchytrium microbalum]|uniref:Pre-mRNA-processing factor 17 n=1 Tax=Synchytrium microbalum TaxID=1806994 RepID=A0A507C6P4_9FUNG|nr:uncharacterized protein SmJEL517_g02354 [Synchytrium microbalum]TPX35292.1 hypothetical protein SmJEL517_g02354 [Synchytrium microbalum]